MNSFLACPNCASAFEHAGGDAAGWAIFMMLCLLVVVLGIVLFVIYRLGKRSRLMADPKFNDQA